MRHVAIRTLFVTAVMALSCVLGAPVLGSGAIGAVASAPTVSACSGDNFWGGWVGKNGAGGTSIFNVAFVNDGHSTCRLSGFPTIQGYKNGREYPLTAGHMNGRLFDIYPTDVAPRMAAAMVITTADDCNALNTGGQTAIKKVIAKDTYPEISVKFPNSNNPVYVYGLALDVACGLDVTIVGWRKSP